MYFFAFEFSSNIAAIRLHLALGSVVLSYYLVLFIQTHLGEIWFTGLFEAALLDHPHTHFVDLFEDLGTICYLHALK